MTNIETNKHTSRRDWFSGSAALLGAGAISSLLLRGQTPSSTNDVNILNFALRLENLESAFYNQVLSMFAAKDFQSSSTLQMIGGTKIGANIYSYIQAIAQHEKDHVAKLTQMITGMGGTPQPLDCYNFGLKSPDNFFQIAQTLENTGVAAYDGALASLQDPNLQTAAATIATVEARHASYINLLALSIPFPFPFDGTLTMQQVLATAGLFMGIGCPGQPAPMVMAIAGPQKHATITTNQTMVTLDGSKSTSGSSQPIMYLWNQDLGSPLAGIMNDTSPVATAILLGGAGVYSISLRVVDPFGNSDQDTIKINYKP